MSLKSLSNLAIAATACVMFSGCAVVNYNASVAEKFDMPVKVKKQYRIASVETVTMNTFSEERALDAKELKLLNAALNNQPGEDFQKYWRQAVPELKKSPGNQDIVSTNLPAWKLNTRSIAPTLFEIGQGTPINIRAVMFIRPASINPWWMLSYLLSATILSPMEKRSLGTVIVAILDEKGKTIDARTVIFRRSYWFSTLFPWALCGGTEFSAKSPGTDPELDEKTVQIQLMSQIVAEMLSGKSPAKECHDWRNIRAAMVEAIASDNNSDALKMVKAAFLKKLGGEECKNYLKILD